MQLGGQVALVTGASRGIGRAVCLALAHEGASTGVNYLPDPDGRFLAGAQETAAACEARGARTLLVSADVADFDQCQEMTRQVVETFGRLDILINNAGILRDRTLRNLTKDDWDAVINVNLTGCFNTCKSVLETMRDQNYGRIVSISSVVGLTGNFGQTNYAAAKAGLLGFSRSLARELARHGVTVNVVAPGLVDTDMTRTIPEDIRHKLIDNIPIGRPQTVEEIASAVVFLASPAQGAITGHCLHVNGGWYMG